MWRTHIWGTALTRIKQLVESQHVTAWPAQLRVTRREWIIKRSETTLIVIRDWIVLQIQACVAKTQCLCRLDNLQRSALWGRTPVAAASKNYNMISSDMPKQRWELLSSTVLKKVRYTIAKPMDLTIDSNQWIFASNLDPKWSLTMKMGWNN